MERIGYDKDGEKMSGRLEAKKRTEGAMMKGQRAEAEGNGFPCGIPI